MLGAAPVGDLREVCRDIVGGGALAQVDAVGLHGLRRRKDTGRRRQDTPLGASSQAR